MPPNGWRVSGERSTAERVRCSRGLGDWLLNMATPRPEKDAEASRCGGNDGSEGRKAEDGPHEDEVELAYPTRSSTKEQTENAEGRDH